MYKIINSERHPLRECFEYFFATRNTRAASTSHNWRLVVPRSRTAQFSRSFVPFVVGLWNKLPASAFDCAGLSGFKLRVNSFLKSDFNF